MTRYPPRLESFALFSSHSPSSCVAEPAAAAAVAAAQQQLLEQHTAAALNICRAQYLSRWQTWCRQGCILSQNGPCTLAWWAVSAENMNNPTINIYPIFNIPYILVQKETVNRYQCLGGFLGHRDGCLEPCATGERATGTGSPRLRGVRAVGFRRDLVASAERGWLGMGRLVPA